MTETKNSILNKYRSGTADDPYVEMIESKKVVNQIIQLSEIPVQLNKVQIEGYFEVPLSSTKDLIENEYRIDYNEGIMTFHPSSNGKLLTLSYLGRGAHYLSSNRIFIDEENGNPVRLLKDLVNDAEHVIAVINSIENGGTYVVTQADANRWNDKQNVLAYTPENNSNKNKSNGYLGIDSNGKFNISSHPTGDGNLHVPATGSNNAGKILKAGATAGSVSWEDATFIQPPQLSYENNLLTLSINIDGVENESSVEIVQGSGDGGTGGNNNSGEGINSHVEGTNTRAIGDSSHAEGFETYSFSKPSHSEGRSSVSGRLFVINKFIGTNYNEAKIVPGETEDSLKIVVNDYTAQGTYSSFHVAQSVGLLYCNDVYSENYNYLDELTVSTITSQYDYYQNPYKEVIIEGVSPFASDYEPMLVAIVLFSDTLIAAHAEGISTFAGNEGAHSEGVFTYALGYNAHAEGNSTVASGNSSHAEGFETKAFGRMAHAEGENTTAWGDSSHTEGKGTSAEGHMAHAEGQSTSAIGESSHAEGKLTNACSMAAHAEGYYTSSGKEIGAVILSNEAIYENNQIIGVKFLLHKYPMNNSFQIGEIIDLNGFKDTDGKITPVKYTGIKVLEVGSDIDNPYIITNHNKLDNNIRYIIREVSSANSSNIGSHTEGVATIAWGRACHAEGQETIATTYFSHAEGFRTAASGPFSHAEGNETAATEAGSHAEGSGTKASGYCSHAEGNTTKATGYAAHAEGGTTTASGYSAHAEGGSTTSSGYCTHSEGSNSISSGYASHAEGSSTISSGYGTHTEGSNTTASANNAHAEGDRTKATAECSHSEGNDTIANGTSSHAEGGFTKTEAYCTHAEGYNTTASHPYSHIMGSFGDTVSDNAWHLANGTSSTNRGLAAKILSTGEMYGDGAYNSTGADYAELFEWADDNRDNEDRVGYFVTLDGEKIRKASSQDHYILGVVSATPSILGDSGGLRWQNKYMTDKWGRIRYQYVLVPAVTSTCVEIDKNNEKIEKSFELSPQHYEWQPVVNPDWNNNEPYVERIMRPEWDAIGMMGKLLVRDDGTCEVNGYCSSNDEGIATSSDSGYRVLNRISESVIKVLIR